jgi:uncharacterized membrane protein
LPFCTNCGTGVDPYASFCHNCGAPQPHPTPQFTDFLEGLSDRTAAILCYIPVFGVIPAIVSSAGPAFYLSGWGMERAIFGLLKLALFVCWIYLLIKAANREQVKLPVIGDLAARSTSEQL